MYSVNDLPSIKAVLEHYGASMRRDHGQVNLKCPFHGDSHQSGTANLDDNLFVCFACGVQGNSLQIIAQQEGCDIRGAAKFAEGTLGHSVQKVPGKHLSGRGLPSKQRYNSGGGTVGTIRRSRGA
jgi:DNA primase